MKWRRFLIGMACVLVCSVAFAQTLKERVKSSYKKAAEWLVSKQEKEGYWKWERFPSVGYTAMATYALAGGPQELRKLYQDHIDKGVKWLLAKQEKDGSFAELGDSNRTYITSVLIMTLVTVDKQKYKDQIKRAKDYLLGAQVKEGLFKGGSGYGDIGGSGKIHEYADLSNTGFVVEAMKMAELPKDSPYWRHVVEFITKCQNNSETNTDPELKKALAELGLKIGNDGGFVYHPKASKAGQEEISPGEKRLKSYGSMTYVGLKSFIHAGLSKQDPRVKAAIEWLRRHYVLDRHPGFGIDEVKRTHLQGLFYYYTMFAKAFDTLGEEIFVTQDGKKREWAKDLAERLLLLQKAEGQKAWKNQAPRWGEGDPVLTTSYCLIAYNTIWEWLK
jgi:squalene-hopene/tetraprenyl-beta-curcumene cyclase